MGHEHMSYIGQRRHEAKDLDGFLAWARAARRGDLCVYHRGDLGHDRASCAATRQLASTVRLLAEYDFLYLSQTRVFDHEREYLATRTGHGTPPRSILRQDITALQFEALRGVLETMRDEYDRRSARRAVRDAIHAPSSAMADRVFDDLVKQGWIESKGAHCGYDLTALGLRMLV